MSNYTRLCKVAHSVAVESDGKRVFTKFRGAVSSPDVVVTADELDAMSGEDVASLCSGKFVLYRD